LVNLYLHGFTDPHIFEYDTLTSEERWNEYADVIFANPPFMSPKAEEVRVLYRDEQGFTQAVRACDIQGVPEFVRAGATLGHLWMEGHFGVGDPLVNQGAPRTTTRRSG